MKTYQNFLSEKISFLVLKFSVYLNRRVFNRSKLQLHENLDIIGVS